MKTLASVLVVVLGLLNGMVVAQDISLVEDFALADDREKVLAQLVPGTEDYYYFHCLHYQNTEQLEKVDQMLKTWIRQRGETGRAIEIQNRQALLKYESDPKASLEYIKRRLGLHFNHQRQIPQAERNLASSLDQKQISITTLLPKALSRHSNTDGVESSGLELLFDRKLNKNQLRHLLQRITIPDHPKLVELIATDLRARDASPFGSYTIHRNLTLDQLSELLELKPDLLNQQSFVDIKLSKLRPNNDVNWDTDTREYRAYLDRLASFVKELGPNQNSLKASVLYRILELNYREGSWDKELFIEYLRLPRRIHYVNQDLIKAVRSQGHVADLNSNYSDRIAVAPVYNDETLVRAHLMHFLKNSSDFKEFLPYVETRYLEKLFAETKIVNGLGEKEKWAAMLSPEEYKALLNRIDLEFLPTNPRFHKIDDAVELELFTKNIDKLIVKVFEINTENYYRTTNREINTDINLDGLVPNWEETHEYDDPPLHRVKRKFKFDQIDKPGVYVVDFIGNGISSRALIRKGRLHYIAKTTFAGQAFMVLDQDDRHVKDATIWMAGRRYNSDEDGMILVPFSTQPRQQPIIISDGKYSVFERFYHQSENYVLRAGIYVDREALLRSRKVQAVVRPQLLINGMPAPVSLLKDITFTIQTTSIDGSTANLDFNDVKLGEGQEATFDFQLPGRVKSIQCILRATVENISKATDQNLAVSESFGINAIDATAHIVDLHFVQGESGYRIEARGKTGEARAKQAVLVQLKHRMFKHWVQASLQTDEKGNIELGNLADIRHLKATTGNGHEQQWIVPSERNRFSNLVHGVVDQTIEIPLPVSGGEPAATDFALFEKRGNQFVENKFDAIELDNGLLKLNGLTPGDYELYLKKQNSTIAVRVTQGDRSFGYVFGSSRKAELRGNRRSHVSEVKSDKDSVTIKIGNALDSSRVHVFATTYVPAFDAYSLFNKVHDVSPTLMTRGVYPSVYIAGRNIGDEYRYILERNYAMKYPGNMLTRPTLLLNPWALRDTSSTVHAPAGGEAFGGAGAPKPSATADAESKQQGGSAGGLADYSNLDFLADGAIVLTNLKPDENGVVTIDREKLGSKHFLQIVVDDVYQTAVRYLTLPQEEIELRDLRLTDGMNPEEHFAQSKQHTSLSADEEFVLNDPLTGKFQQFDDLGDVYRLFTSLTGDKTLQKFAFILDWHEKELEEKKQLYTEFACHELNYFLLKKDREFFDEVVQPYLKNKRDKTFLDHWLVEGNVDRFAYGWQFDQLNTVEQILISQRLDEAKPGLVRRIEDQYSLSPSSVAEFDHMFGYIFETDSLSPESLSGRLDRTRGLAVERYKGESMRQSAGQGADLKYLGDNAGKSGGRDRGRRREMAENFARDKEIALESMTEGLKDVQGRLEADELRVLFDYDDGDDGKKLGEKNVKKLANKRKQLRQLFRRLKPTQEWVENNYYHLPIAQHTASRVTVNRFWRDYANSNPGESFLSPYFAEATGNFSEMMFALAVLDLPFSAPEHETEVTEDEMKFKSGGNVIAFYQQISPTRFERVGSTILISENFFRNDDRYTQDGDRRYDKFVTDEFLTNVLYGGQVVITNPTSTPQTVDLLIQIPEGAMPVAGSEETKSTKMDLAAFSTQTVEYFFYFPLIGDFGHYPAHVSEDDRAIAVAEPQSFNVVDTPSNVDRSSWAYISQNGTGEEVIDFLESENVLAVDLNRIAFRMKDKKFFNEATRALNKRFIFHPTLWSYSILHDDKLRMREYLSRDNAILNQAGGFIDTPLLTVNRVERYWYEQREFWPLVNARTHQLGSRRKILNSAIYEQYHRLMYILAARPELNSYDELAVTYYLLLQDRVTEALAHFDQVNPKKLESKIQYDYCKAYLAMYMENPDEADSIAQQYVSHPVKRWRDLFSSVVAQVAEIRDGTTTEATDVKNQAQTQTELASKSRSFDFSVEAGKVNVNYQNLDNVSVNYYLMDIELLFSRNPFVQQQADGFTFIKPNTTDQIDLPRGTSNHSFELPDSLDNKNILVELSSGDQTKSKAYYANSLNLQMIENYGQLRVTDVKSGKPMSKVYVKVYANKADGSVHFYKDGYTDLRGRFDYASLSNQKLDDIRRFAVLVLSEENGAVVREANVPKE